MKTLPALVTLSLTALTLGALTSAGCASNDEPAPSTEPRSGESDADLVGTVIEIAGTDLAGDRVHAIAQAVEQKTGAHMAKVAVRKDGEDTHIMVEVWAPEAVPAGFEEELRSEFSELASAEITRADIGRGGPTMTQDGEGPMGGHPDIDPDDDPETIKQKIIEDMRAKGVEGDIHVTVEDAGDGKRAIKVEVEDERHD